MASNYIKMLILLVILHMITSLSYYGVEGGRSISKAIIDLDLNNQLKILNKPPVKTIKTEEGENFDCIDIHKQPAFDHPLLKNHKIQMSPNSRPEGLSDETLTSSDDHQSLLMNALQDFDCPEGTVPIRRTTKEDLIRAKSFSESFKIAPAGRNNRPVPTNMPVTIHEAGLHSLDNVTRRFHGIHGYINTANPKVENQQLSAAVLLIQAGPADDVNSIGTGWAVAPSIFGDSNTRFFVDWHGAPSTGCFNLLCPGFVQLDKHYTVGSVVKRISEYGGTQYNIKLHIYQDKTTGHWWLIAGERDKVIGYWPRDLFPHMGQKNIDGADYVEWGGYVSSGTSGTRVPQMGNGHFPDFQSNKACSIVNLKVVNERNTLVDIDDDSFVFFATSNNQCYRIEDDGFINNAGGQGYSFMFGGPGGDNCD